VCLDSADDLPLSSNKIIPPPTASTMTGSEFATFMKEALNSPHSSLSRAIVNGEEPYTSEYARLHAYFLKTEKGTRRQSQGGHNRAEAIKNEFHARWQRDAEALWARGEAWWDGEPGLATAAKKLSKLYEVQKKYAPPAQVDYWIGLARSPRQIRNKLQKPV